MGARTRKTGVKHGAPVSAATPPISNEPFKAFL